MINEIFTLLGLILELFKQIFPYWIGGVITGSLISVYASGKITGFVSVLGGKTTGFLAIIFAPFLGVASPVCMFGTVPLIVSLARKGVPQYILAAFMISSILLNPNLFLMSFALGADIALLRLALSLIAGMLAGLLARVFFNNRELFDLSCFSDKGSFGSKKKTFLQDIQKSISITGPYFLAGIALTALFDRYFPKEMIYTLFTFNRGLGVLLAASLGVPIYVCGGGTIPLILAWLQSGMSVGSAAAFMITGPATKLTNLSAVKIILGKRNFILYLIFNLAFAVLSGLFIDFVF